jgi:hypothetical protein
MAEIKLERLSLKSLKFAEYNPRQINEKQFQNLVDSVQTFGQVDPIIVNTHNDRKNIIVGGNTRIKVINHIIEKGLDIFPKTDKATPARDYFAGKVDAVKVCLDLEAEKELNIRLNKNTGEFDFDLLANFFEVDELKTWGFEEWELGHFNDELDDVQPIDESEINEAINFQIKCKDLDELDKLQKSLGTESRNITAEQLLKKLQK